MAGIIIAEPNATGAGDNPVNPFTAESDDLSYCEFRLQTRPKFDTEAYCSYLNPPIADVRAWSSSSCEESE